ncbi:MAG: alpha/beta hydrolase-fold protein [Ferruginibacter sp.]
MKKFTFFLLLSFNCFSTCAQQNNKITIGTIDSVQSKILHENRAVWVYVPNNKNDGVKERYPVIYVLDGNALFSSVVALVQQFGETDWNWILPKMIVVGIPSTYRVRDLTPTHIEEDPPFRSREASKETGGGENFVSFMKNELIPHIDSLYPTQPHKILIGHSFGGLTAINILANHSNLFNSFICIDPSMWWDNLHFLEATKKALTQDRLSGKSLYVSLSGSINEDIDTAKMRKDTLWGFSRHFRGILELDDFLKSQPQNGLRYEFKFYKNENHMSLPFITEHDGLRFIFKDYFFTLSDKEESDSTFNVAEKLKNHFQRVSQMLGYTMEPPVDMVSQYGNSFIGEKQYYKARQLFKLNIENYPNSYIVYNAYGDYLTAIGDKAQAAGYFKKALLLKENPESRKKLKELVK